MTCYSNCLQKNTFSDADDDHVQNLKHDQQKQTDLIEYETCPWENLPKHNFTQTIFVALKEYLTKEDRLNLSSNITQYNI